MRSIQQAPAALARRCYSFDRAVYDRATERRRTAALDLDLGLPFSQAKPASGTLDFSAAIPTAALILQSDRGIVSSGGFVDSWTDTLSGSGKIASATLTTRPALIVGPNGQPALQGDGINDALTLNSFAAPAPSVTPSSIYAVVRQDAWSLNAALWGSPNAEFTLRVLQFSASPSVAMSQTNPTGASTPAIGTYVRMIVSFQANTTDFIRMGSVIGTGVATPPNTAITGLQLFNHFTGGPLPCACTYVLFLWKNGIFTGPELTAADAMVTAKYGASVIL